MYVLGSECVSKGVSVYLDAEFTQYQPGVRILALTLINIFNKQNQLIINKLNFELNYDYKNELNLDCNLENNNELNHDHNLTIAINLI